MNELISENKNNLVQPVGGRIITTNDGQVAWVGFGIAVVDQDEELDVPAELDLEAERTAGTRAVDALAVIIREKGLSVLLSRIFSRKALLTSF